MTYKSYTKIYGTDFTSFWNSRSTNMADDELRDQVVDSIKEIDQIVATKGIEIAEDGEKLNSYQGYLLDAFGGTGTKMVEVKVTRAERDRRRREISQAKRNGTYTGSAANQSYANTGQGLVTKFVPQSVGTADALYWYASDNKEFMDRGYNTFKNYKTTLDQYMFDTEDITTGTTGFIPVTLSLKFDGLGGIKIYNNIKVNTRALPASYPQALKFVVDGVKHNVENNLWTTDISTISQPVTSKPVRRKITKSKEIYVKSTDGGSTGKLTKDVSKFTDAQKKTLTSGYSLIANNGSKNGLIYAPEETEKIQFVVHHTAGLGGAKPIIASWRKKTIRVSTHFIIDRAGNVEQLFPLKYWGNHIGSSRKGNHYLQKSTISVELVALGYLKVQGKSYKGNLFTESSVFQQGNDTYTYSKLKQGQPDVPVAQPYKMNSDGKIVKAANYKGYGLFHSYTKKQLTSLRRVMQKVRKEYPNITFGTRYSGANAFYEQFPKKKQAETAWSFNRGTFTHNSYRTDKSDVFPQKELIYLFKEFNK